jgi:hypothetical protein
MIINITNKTTVRNIQRKITVTYPFLKIEFFHGQGKSNKEHWFDQDCRLLEIAKDTKPGWIVIHPWHTASCIKETFERRFGLHAQFFRRLIDEWIEITGTEVFTIEEQNQIGRKSVEKIHAPAWRERELLL